ncbi:MAG: hypothetical protein ACTSVU_00830 [Promethearchaeota archaeon]
MSISQDKLNETNFLIKIIFGILGFFLILSMIFSWSIMRFVFLTLFILFGYLVYHFQMKNEQAKWIKSSFDDFKKEKGDSHRIVDAHSSLNEVSEEDTEEKKE